MSEIEKIASVHLGKAGDGSVVKPYQTPDSVDPSLLVGIPRYLNRTQYNIEEDNLPFEGVDVWNAYEFSCLLDNGFPLSGWLKFAYPADTPNIVESKSVKLYLNSYNMAKMGSTVEGAVNEVADRVSYDLKKALGLEDGYVDVYIFHEENLAYTPPLNKVYIPLEEYVQVEQIEFSHYNEDPAILKVVEKTSANVDRYKSRSLRSNCRVTNQPDWGDVYVHIKGSKTVTPESLLQYIVSMRKENHFHEEICECIYKRLWDLLEPDELLVACLYTRRGGIDINPVRASDAYLLWEANICDVGIPSIKTARQ